MKSILWRLIVDEDAPMMAEYALLLVLIALLVFVSVVFLGQGISTLFTRAGSHVGEATIPTIP